MKIAIVEPGQNTLLHRVRGTGFYIKNLVSSLKKFDGNNEYVFCTSKDIPDDANIVHYPYFEPFFLTLPLFEKRKLVVTVHDLIPFVFPKNFPRGIKGNLRWEIQKRILRRANMIITDSNSSKEDIEKFVKVDANKIKAIYLAASDKFKKLENAGDVRRKYNLPEKFVLYVGDVTWNKNLPRLIEAVRGLDLPLVMVGKALVDEDFDRENPWNSDLSKVHDLAQNYSKLIRPGFVEDNDLVKLYNLATVFAMPSIYEGFGLPILEAMGCSCPVVTSRGGSIPEIAGDAAIYVDPYSVENIAQGIKDLFYNEDLRRSFRKKAIDQSKKFSWEKTTKETIKLYESLI